ncbi:MAG: FlgD immunoglobulin-like domain containing protein [bacterium]
MKNSKVFLFLFFVLVAAILLAGALPAFATITARIDYPEAEGRLYGNVKIAGVAQATGEFNSYVLEVKNQPDGPWQTIAQGNIQVPEPFEYQPPRDILGVWETGGFQSGEYQIRLTVYAEGTSQSVTVNRIFRESCTYVNSISVDPVTFNPYAGESATVAYSLPEAGEVTIRFYDAFKSIVDTSILGAQSAGTHMFVWGGLGPGAGCVNDTAYTLSIQLKREDQTLQIYYPSDGLEEVTPTNTSISSHFKPQRNELCQIGYTIDRPSWVRIGVGTAEIMWDVLHRWGNPIEGYVPRLSGAHTDYWDGRKGLLSSVPPLVSEPETQAVIWAHTLPDNFIITEGKFPVITNLQANPVIIDLTRGQSTDLSYTLSKEMNMTIKIYDGTYPEMRLVRTLINNQQRASGVHTEHWDGLSDQGFPGAPPSPYTFAIEGTDMNGLSAEPRFGAFVIKGH